MATVEEHYRDHLAPLYVWMAGGLEAALTAGAAELTDLALPARPGDIALDLGCGFGMHAIPLARRGARVLAIDASQDLLDVLTGNADALQVRTVRGDLLDFQAHLTEAPRLVLCMGDTLTHLPDPSSVEQLAASVAREIQSGGTFVLTFRDYTRPLEADKRFIPVRGDADRILTCFLEYEADVVRVHDVLHRRDGDTWHMTVSSYRKLRVHPQELGRLLRGLGFTVELQAGVRGLTRLVCTAA